jgi:curved DNA-binding protein
MAVKFKDYYETLNVTRTASPDEIKQAFRKLARQYHPDVAKNQATAEEKFKEINEAYEVLSDPEKRRRYDELGAHWQDAAAGSAPPHGGQSRWSNVPPDASEFEFGGTGYSDFFESFFSGGREGFGFSRRGATRGGSRDAGGFAFPGSDVEADILVTLDEVLRGSQRKITLRRPPMNGESERTNTYQVRIPPGVREGQRIRLAGQGEPGHGGGAAGDLYLRVRLARHPDLSVRDADLYYELELAPWEAVLGVQARIPTLDGTTSLRVPAGTLAGSRLRLRGLGLPREDHGRGDLYATVTIQTPATVSAEERVLWENLARVSTFKPRTLS